MQLDVASRPPGPADHGAPATGLVLISPEGRIQVVTPPARAWLADLPVGIIAAPLPGRFPVIGAQGGEGGAEEVEASPGRRPTLSMQTLSGRWLVLDCSVLEHTGQLAVILHEATPAQLLPTLIDRYGFTGREAQVVRLLLDGLAVKQVARRLALSPLTVNDHLKSIYRKAGVHGRDELTARLNLRGSPLPG